MKCEAGPAMVPDGAETSKILPGLKRKTLPRSGSVDFHPTAQPLEIPLVEGPEADAVFADGGGRAEEIMPPAAPHPEIAGLSKRFEHR
jgi:hypothetical protein